MRIVEEKSPEVRGLEKTIASLRAQMKLQSAEWSKAALALAREVNGAMIGSSPLGVAIVNQESAKKAYELAQEMLGR